MSEHGEEEGQCLARAGLGDTDHIPTTHNSGYGLSLEEKVVKTGISNFCIQYLDWCWFVIAILLQQIQYL